MVTKGDERVAQAMLTDGRKTVVCRYFFDMLIDRAAGCRHDRIAAIGQRSQQLIEPRDHDGHGAL